jgi:dihydroneopterin aldolase
MKTKEKEPINNKIMDNLVSEIVLSGMEFYALHGCFDEEKIIGTRFKVDLKLISDTLEAAKNDDLKKTINYQCVYQDVRNIMNRPVNILETICLQIIKMIQVKYPTVVHAEVTVYKLNPSIGGKVNSVSVTSRF